MGSGRCIVCRHPERERIDRELARGEGTVVLGHRYGLNRNSLRRHRERHLWYLLDPALGLSAWELAGIQAAEITTVAPPGGGF